MNLGSGLYQEPHPLPGMRSSYVGRWKASAQGDTNENHFKTNNGPCVVGGFNFSSSCKRCAQPNQQSGLLVWVGLCGKSLLRISDPAGIFETGGIPPSWVQGSDAPTLI